MPSAKRFASQASQEPQVPSQKGLVAFFFVGDSLFKIWIALGFCVGILIGNEPDFISPRDFPYAMATANKEVCKSLRGDCMSLHHLRFLISGPFGY